MHLAGYNILLVGVCFLLAGMISLYNWLHIQEVEKAVRQVGFVVPRQLFTFLHFLFYSSVCITILIGIVFIYELVV